MGRGYGYGSVYRVLAVAVVPIVVVVVGPTDPPVDASARRAVGVGHTDRQGEAHDTDTAVVHARGCASTCAHVGACMCGSGHVHPRMRVCAGERARERMRETAQSRQVGQPVLRRYLGWEGA